MFYMIVKKEGGNMKINQINLSQNAFGAKFDKKLQTKVVNAYANATHAERCAMDYSLKGIADKFKGTTISQMDAWGDESYYMNLGHEKEKFICVFPKRAKASMVQVLQKIDRGLSDVDEITKGFYKASMHVDEVMKNG